MKFNLGRSVGAAMLIAALFALAGCGGSNGGGNNGGALLTSIAVSGSSSVNVQATAQLTATGTYTDGSTKDITTSVSWKSSTTANATISTGGVVAGVHGGSTTITASLGAVASPGFGVTVVAQLQSVSISPSSSTVYVGSTLQYTATGTYNDGTTGALTGLTWKSSDTTKATISSTGLASGVHGGSGVTITGTYQSVSGTAPLSVVALLTSVTIDPIGPGILVGGTTVFTLTGNFNDGTTQNVASTAAWSSSDSAKATVSAGTATGVAVGVVTITGTATSADGSTQAASTAMDIVATTVPPIQGDYAFNLEFADTRGSAFCFGSLTADGNGNITAGVMDSNSLAGVQQNVPLTGTYFMYPDGRGSMTLNANSILPNGAVYRFIASGSNGTVSTLGKMIEFDGNGTEKGSFELQDPTSYNTSALSGDYVFRLSGTDVSSNPLGQVGFMAMDGGGNITAGTADTNDFGTITALDNLSATTYTVGAEGRGTAAITTSAGTNNYVIYAISASKFNLMQVDAESSSLAGVAELQSGGPFTTATLASPYALQLQRPALVNENGFDRREFASIGSYAYDGLGMFIGIRDDANNGTDNPLTNINGPYSISGQNGRGTIQATSSVNFRAYTFYMVNPSKMYMLQTFNSPTAGSLNAPVGLGVQQVGIPFGPASLSGIYTMNLSDLTVTYTEALMRMTFDGVSNLNGIADLSINKVISAVALDNATYTINANSTSGRGTVVLPAPLGANNYAFYLESNSNAFLLGLTPDAEGTIDLQ